MRCFSSFSACGLWLVVGGSTNVELAASQGHWDLSSGSLQRQALSAHENITLHNYKPQQSTSPAEKSHFLETLSRSGTSTGASASLTDILRLRSKSLPFSKPFAGQYAKPLPLERQQVAVALLQTLKGEEGAAIDNEETQTEQKEAPKRSQRQSRVRRLGRAIAKRLRQVKNRAGRFFASIRRFIWNVLRRLLRRTTSSAESQPRFSEFEKGPDVVAEAVARVAPSGWRGRVSSRTALMVEILLKRAMPRNQNVIFRSIRSGATLAFRRGPVVGEGGFAKLVSLTSSQGVQYVGKFIRMTEGDPKMARSLAAQFDILKQLRPGVDVWKMSHHLGIAFPLDLVEKRFEMDLFDLANRLRSSNPDDNTILLSLTQQIVKSVSNFHNLGLAHLDLKPANFLINRVGRVYLGDFDGAKLLGNPVFPTFCSESFASPELLKIMQTEDRFAGATVEQDAWSLGMTIYTLWCPKEKIRAYSECDNADDVLECVSRVSEAGINLNPDCTVFMPREVFDLIKEFLKVDARARLTPAKAAASHAVMVLPVLRATGQLTPESVEPLTESSPITSSYDASSRGDSFEQPSLSPEKLELLNTNQNVA